MGFAQLILFHFGLLTDRKQSSWSKGSIVIVKIKKAESKQKTLYNTWPQRVISSTSATRGPKGSKIRPKIINIWFSGAFLVLFSLAFFRDDLTEAKALEVFREMHSLRVPLGWLLRLALPVGLG